jgi:hypothetical protein
MNTVRCPDVHGAVELEEYQKCQEDAGNTGEIGIDQEILGGWSNIVVEAILIDINTKENAAGDEENVVVNKLLSDGIVEGRGAR